MIATVLSPATQYAIESIASCRADGVEALLAAHYHEIARYPDIPLDVDWARYEQAELNGTLRVMTARQGRLLVGYAAYLVAPHWHYKGSLQAIQDVLYVHPDYRGSRVGYKLIAMADQYLALEGVQVVYQHSKIAHPIGAVLARQGYEPIDLIYGKRLDR